MAAGRAGRAGQFNGMLKILPGFPAMSARRPSGIHCVAHFSGNAAAGILEFSLQVIHEEEEEEEEEEEGKRATTATTCQKRAGF